MQIPVEYKDATGRIHAQAETVSFLQLLKSFALAGQGNLPEPEALRRAIGAFLFYCDYLNPDHLSAGAFGQPPTNRQDPTEKNQFSNQAGKALADLFARRYLGAKISQSYEAAMAVRRIRIKGRRPDFLCDTGAQMIAVEAKGYARDYVSSKDMKGVKDQSQRGPVEIRRNCTSTVASVAYGLYSDLKVKFYDPPEDETFYDRELSRLLVQAYYAGLQGFFKDQEHFEVQKTFLRERLIYRILINPGSGLWSAIMHCAAMRLGFGQVAILISDQALQASKEGDIKHLGPPIEERGVWLDSDGIGIQVEMLGVGEPPDREPVQWNARKW